MKKLNTRGAVALAGAAISTFMRGESNIIEIAAASAVLVPGLVGAEDTPDKLKTPEYVQIVASLVQGFAFLFDRSGRTWKDYLPSIIAAVAVQSSLAYQQFKG